MKKTRRFVDMLNDLILINNDRITGYEKAAHLAHSVEPEIKNVFHHMASESRKNVTELHTLVQAQGGEPASGTTAAGKLYRAWKTMKTSFTGTDSLSLLAACEAGEDAAQKAYLHAMQSAEPMPAEMMSTVRRQQEALKSSHDLIKRYRDTKTFSHR